MVCKNPEILKHVWKVSLKDTHKILVLIWKPFGLTGFFYSSEKIHRFLIDLAAFISFGRFGDNPNSEEIMERFQKSVYFLILKPSRMTKNHICFQYFPKTIDFSRKFKESRTHVNFSKQFNNASNTKKKVLLRLFQKNFMKSLECF